MILMVCGTQKFPLDRMLMEMDRLIEAGAVTQPVFAQIGHSTYRPRHYEWAEFLPGDVFEEKIRRCSILLTHSGVGTILTGKELGRPVLVYPRSAKYGEHVDDHQWQIALEFQKRGYVLVCEEQNLLGQRLRECESYPFRQLTVGDNVQTGVIREHLGKGQSTGK